MVGLFLLAKSVKALDVNPPLNSQHLNGIKHHNHRTNKICFSWIVFLKRKGSMADPKVYLGISQHWRRNCSNYLHREVGPQWSPKFVAYLAGYHFLLNRFSRTYLCFSNFFIFIFLKWRFHSSWSVAYLQHLFLIIVFHTQENNKRIN